MHLHPRDPLCNYSYNQLVCPTSPEVLKELKLAFYSLLWIHRTLGCSSHWPMHLNLTISWLFKAMVPGRGSQEEELIWSQWTGHISCAMRVSTTINKVPVKGHLIMDQMSALGHWKGKEMSQERHVLKCPKPNLLGILEGRVRSRASKQTSKNSGESVNSTWIKSLLPGNVLEQI